ncbi:MAG: OmpH family outer membrane protein [Alphaproteobacteria bacterium]|nr:OmpH family outer membrane protein [Alphaproteobacteria bacterium]
MRVILIAFFIAVCAAPVAGPRQAAAQQLPAPVIAVIDVSEVERRSIAWRDLTTKIDAQREAIKGQLGAEEQAIRDEDAALSQQQTVLDPTIFAQRQNALRERVANLQRAARQNQQEIERLFNLGRAQIQTILRQAATQIAAELGVNIMLNISNNDQSVLFVDPAFVVTEEALKRLDAAIQTVDLTRQPAPQQ